jgi:putative ABC transport system substrate-binding protein
MNKPFTISIAITLLLASAAFLIYQQSKKGLSRLPTKRIAIFYPATHPAMTEIEQGIKETMQKDSNATYSFDVFNANGNKTLLHTQAEEIIGGNYDLAISVGAMCSQTLAEVARKRSSSTPLIFTAVENPGELGLSQANYPLTGVTSSLNLPAQLSALLEVKPTTKSILLVYNPAGSPGLERYKNELENLTRKHHVTFKAVAVYNSNEIMEKTAPQLKDVDTVMILTDHTAVTGLDALLKLAQQHGITLYASDLNSAERGAALAFGITEFTHGKEAAKQALRILENGIDPKQIPFSNVTEQSILKINEKTAASQGIMSGVKIVGDALTTQTEQK